MIRFEALIARVRAYRRAYLLIRSAPYLFVRRHEWRRFQIDRSGLWPRITFGRRTWDTLPDQSDGPHTAGERVADLLDELRRARG